MIKFITQEEYTSSLYYSFNYYRNFISQTKDTTNNPLTITGMVDVNFNKTLIILQAI